MDTKQQQKMETTDHLFESIHCVYSNKSCQNTNIPATTVGNPNTKIPRFFMVFGLPTSNTEYCQMPPNTIWEQALIQNRNNGLSPRSGNFEIEVWFALSKHIVNFSFKGASLALCHNHGTVHRGTVNQDTASKFALLVCYRTSLVL